MPLSFVLHPKMEKQEDDDSGEGQTASELEG